MNLLPPIADVFSAHAGLIFFAKTVVVLFLLVVGTTLGLVLQRRFMTSRRARSQRAMAIAIGILAPARDEPERLNGLIAEAVRRAGRRAAAAVLRRFRMQVKEDLKSVLLSRHLEDLGEVDRLGKLTRARRSWPRIKAAQGLGECGGQRAAAYLAGLLQDPDAEVGHTARDGLLASGEPGSVQAAVESYLREGPTRRGWKAAFYARLAAVAPADLCTLLSQGRLAGLEEKLALEALGDVREPGAAPLAAARIHSPDPELRVTAVRVIGKLGCLELREAVLHRLADSLWFVRAVAARALETLGEDTAIEEGLARALRDTVWWVRANAARALSRRGEAGLRQLVAAVDANDRYAWDSALTALVSAGALARLGEHLQDLVAAHPEDPFLKALAARAESLRA